MLHKHHIIRINFSNYIIIVLSNLPQHKYPLGGMKPSVIRNTMEIHPHFAVNSSAKFIWPVETGDLYARKFITMLFAFPSDFSLIFIRWHLIFLQFIITISIVIDFLKLISWHVFDWNVKLWVWLQIILSELHILL